MKLDLIYGRNNLGGGEKSLEVSDTEVGDTDGSGLAGLDQLFHLLPGVGKLPVLVGDGLLLRVDGVCEVGQRKSEREARELTDRDGPVHENQVDVVGLEPLQGLVHGLGDVLVVHVVDLGGQEEGFSGDTGILDSVSDFGLVSVSLSAARGCQHRLAKGIPADVRVNVLVAGQQGGLDGLSDLVGLGLPCAETDGGDFAPSVELEGESGKGSAVPDGGREVLTLSTEKPF